MRAASEPVLETLAGEQDMPSNWVQSELGAVDLGDKRLNRRLLATAGELAAQPSAPVNQACADWAATKASYRLFRNDRVTAAAILAPHQTQTQARMAEYDLVLAVQDSTYLDYSTHPQTTRLGPIGTPQQQLRGLVQHSTLALTPTGLPLGVLTQAIWARDPDAPELSAYERRTRPIAEKESYKWLTALRETVQQTPSGVTVVSVCDREADVYELFVEAEHLKTGLLVRATQDRALLDAETGKVWATVTAVPVWGQLQVHVPARHDEPERDAIVAVRCCQVTLKPPWRRQHPDQEPLPPITLDVVLVQEVAPPDKGTPLEWLLLTNVPVQTFADAVERVQWYRCRWHIEVYFKVLKSGCRVEDCRLGDAERLKRFITLTCVIAWRLYWLTHINRQMPEAPCTLVLVEHEWHALYAKMQRTTAFPAQPPTVRQALHWIARLGGFLDRRRDGEPGIITIWRGWQRLQDMADMWRVSRNDTYG
jgi:hypothetical protein